MFGKMKELMEMKKQADRIKKELDAAIVEVEEVKGIRIKINGSQIIKDIHIEEDVLTKGRERIQSDVMRSVNAAIKKSQGLAAEKMRSMMPAGFPGM